MVLQPPREIPHVSPSLKSLLCIARGMNRDKSQEQKNVKPVKYSTLHVNSPPPPRKIKLIPQHVIVL